MDNFAKYIKYENAKLSRKVKRYRIISAGLLGLCITLAILLITL